MPSLSRRPRPLLAVVATVFGATLLLSACGGDPSGTAPPGDEAGPAESEFSPDLEPMSLDPDAFTPSHSIGFTGSVSTMSGYTFDFSLSSEDVLVSPDVANSPPGRMKLTLIANGQLELTNTTPQRNAPVTALSGGLGLSPAYPMTAAVCEFRQNGDIVDYDVSDFDTYIELGCAAPVGVVVDTTNQPDLGPGESVVIPLRTQRELEVPEQSAATIEQDLAEPTWWIGYSSESLSVDGWTDDALPQDCRVSARDEPLVWASAPLPGCAIPAIGSAAPQGVPEGLVPQAETALAAVITRAGDLSNGTRSLDSCPFGEIEEVTEDAFGIPPDTFTSGVTEMYDHPQLDCFSDLVRIFAAPTAPDDDLTARVVVNNDSGPFAVSPEVPLYGGRGFVVCPANTEQVCTAAWRSESMVVWGFAGGRSVTRDPEFQAHWLATNLPTMLEQLVS